MNMKEDKDHGPAGQRATASEGCRHFLAELLAALGWSNTRAVDVKTEADILGEVRRLRRSAGEVDDDRPLVEIETYPVARVHRVGGQTPRHASLWVTTRAGVVETCTQQDGGPRRLAAVEQPEARSTSCSRRRKPGRPTRCWVKRSGGGTPQGPEDQGLTDSLGRQSIPGSSAFRSDRPGRRLARRSPAARWSGRD